MNKLCFPFGAFDGRGSGRGGSGGTLLSLPQDIDPGSTGVPVNSCDHADKYCNRSLDAFVVS